MGRTFSTTLRGYFCRALYIPHSNDKYVQGRSIAQSGVLPSVGSSSMTLHCCASAISVRVQCSPIVKKLQIIERAHYLHFLTFAPTAYAGYCTRLNRSVADVPLWQQIDARNIRSAVGNFYLLVVFGFRTAIVDGTRKERDCRSSLLEQDSISLFYCNSHTAILNPHQPQEKRSFSESFWCRFFQKGAVLRSSTFT